MLLVDSDAFRCLRELHLLLPLCEAFQTCGVEVRMLGYAAEHELNLIQVEVMALRNSGLLQVSHVSRGTPAMVRYRQFLRDGYDKGEAEAIAWAMDIHRDSRPLFVTRDDLARRLATQNGVPVTDVLGVLLEAVDVAGLPEALVESQLAPWDDPSQQICKPRGYSGFAEAAARHRANRPLWSRS